jgi:hypothetical protein
MRFDTHRISAFLVRQLQFAKPLLEVIDDGGDLIHVRMATGQTVAIYLIESPITVYEIRGIVEANTAAGVYSLFVLWGDLFLPIEGSHYRPDDWMAALLALGGDKIYGFDPYGGDNLVFPVYFDGEGLERSVRHGTPIDVTHLNCARVQTRSPYIRGVWLMADFELAGQARERHRDPMLVYYETLGLHRKATHAMVKRAYRHLARKYHPDVNPTPEATRRMQQINDAYERIMQALDSEPPTQRKQQNR